MRIEDDPELHLTLASYLVHALVHAPTERLPPYERMLLLTLAVHAFDNGLPLSIDSLPTSPRTVRKHLRALRDTEPEDFTAAAARE
jgi:hypothetical protein